MGYFKKVWGLSLSYADVLIDELGFVDKKKDELLRAQVHFGSFRQNHCKLTSLKNERYLMTLVNLCE